MLTGQFYHRVNINGVKGLTRDFICYGQHIITKWKKKVTQISFSQHKYAVNISFILAEVVLGSWKVMELLQFSSFKSYET